MINHYFLNNSPVCKDQDELPETQVGETIFKTNENSEFPGDANNTTDLKPGRFEQSISVGSPDNLF